MYNKIPSGKRWLSFALTIIFTLTTLMSITVFGAGGDEGSLQELRNSAAPSPTPTPTGFWVSLYIAPDVDYTAETAPLVKSGFTVSFKKNGQTVGSFVTNGAGFCQVRMENGIYDIVISKTNYLTRTLQNISIDNAVTISTAEEPVKMWAGDLNIKGSQDGAINMADIVEHITYFNSAPGNEKYNAYHDFNQDNAINMTDILIIIKNFNKTSADYAGIVIPTPTPDTIILDDQHGSYSETGTWNAVKCICGYNGTMRVGSTLGSTASWSLTIPKTAYYEISALVRNDVNNTEMAKYSVYVNNDPVETFYKSQKDSGEFLLHKDGSLNTFQRYHFTAGAQVKVTLAVTSQGLHVADAIKFKILPEDFVTPTPVHTPPCGFGIPVMDEAENTVFDQSIARISNFITACDDGDSLIIPDVMLSGACGFKSTNIFIANVAVAPQNEGKQVEIRLDGKTGTLLGTLTLQSTGGTAPNFREQVVRLNNVNSNLQKRNVCLVFKGGSNIADFDWFKLTGDMLSEPAQPRPPVNSTPTPTPTDMIILDNSSDYVETGSWKTISEGINGYSRYSTTIGDTVSWTFTASESRYYEIYADVPVKADCTNIASYFINSLNHSKTIYKSQANGVFDLHYKVQEVNDFDKYFLAKGEKVTITLTVASQGVHYADSIRVKMLSQGWTPPPVPTMPPCGYGHPVHTEAENTVLGQNITLKDSGISSCDDGEYVVIRNVLLSGCSGSKNLNVFGAKARVSAQNEGMQVEIRVGGVAGSLLGTLTLKNTGESTKYFDQLTKLAKPNTSLNPVDIYLVFKGGSNIADFDSFWLNRDYNLYPWYTTPIIPTPTAVAPTNTPTPTSQMTTPSPCRDQRCG
ncbi:MAG: carbohydrate-binding protein [Clostridia bacterium]|nr:carbohydrate-binding protein [Clostridia bacterium]